MKLQGCLLSLGMSLLIANNGFAQAKKGKKPAPKAPAETHAVKEDAAKNENASENSEETLRKKKKEIPQVEKSNMGGAIHGGLLNIALSLDTLTIKKDADTTFDYKFSGIGLKALGGYAAALTPQFTLGGAAGLVQHTLSGKSSVDTTIGAIDVTYDISALTLRLEALPVYFFSDFFGLGAVLAYDTLLSGTFKLSVLSTSETYDLKEFSALSYGLRGFFRVTPSVLLEGSFAVGNGKLNTKAKDGEASTSASKFDTTSILFGALFTF